MMKTGILIFVAATIACAQNARPEASPTPPATQSIPASALPAGPNLFRYTDASGKSWLYSRTPFGISRREDTPALPAATEAPSATVVDLGDSVRFEIKTPFGSTRWVSKKADLTDGEQILLLRQQLKNQCAVQETK